MSELRILVTAFEPFGGAARNPSAEVASRIGRHESRHANIRSAVLPVSSLRAPRRLELLLRDYQPHRILMLGEARGATRLRLERRARNRLDFPGPDNDGVTIRDRPITVGGPAVRVAGLPVDAVLQRLEQIAVPCEASEDAGAFLCNQVMYLALEWCESAGALGGFVHLPGLEGDVSSGLPLGLELRAIEETLSIVACGVAPPGVPSA